ncbi:MAG: rod shape-determining protein MreD [Thermomicrobiales bacterium]
MARLLFALLLATAAFSQATVMPALQLLGVLPNLVLVLLLVWCALRGTAEGLMWVFGAGLLLDALALDPFGTNGLSLLVVALLAGPARRRFFHSGLVFPIVLAMIATVIHAVVLLLIRGGTGDGLPVASVFRLVVLQALLNSLLVPPIYLIAGVMDRWVMQADA